MSRDNRHVENVAAGMFLGALAGAGLGLGACIVIFETPPMFTGDTILIGSIVGGALGYVLSEGFIEWLKENWWWFW